MDKVIIKTENAPAPIGPYNQAVWGGSTLYLSGQIAIDPATGKLKIGDVEAETRLVMKNIQGILEHAGLTFAHVVKCSIFLSDMNNFSKVNAIYGEYFPAAAPARETVEVSKLPKGVNVEISAIAIR